MAAAVPRRRRADLRSRDARKEDRIPNRYDREHGRYGYKNQSSLPKDSRRYNFPNSRWLGLFDWTGKKERNGIARRETIFNHRSMPQARAPSLARLGTYSSLWRSAPLWITEIALGLWQAR